MVKTWAVVEMINGIRTVTNKVCASDEVAKERGYEDLQGVEVGAQEIGGHWIVPVPGITPSRMDRLIEILENNKTISAEEAKSLKR